MDTFFIDSDFDTPSTFEKRKSMMTLLYIKHLLKILPQVIKDKCYGCQVDHPSQRHHDVCLMMTTEEKIEVCLETALTRLDHHEIYREYQEKYPDVDEDTMDSFFFFYGEWIKDLKEILVLFI